ncbi:MAG: long-chain fatty acid--CoA ligase [Desulfomonile tiedjei]|nr:long-chain fatty acid--CoA ligase [Desulfomonile tiedjei]
MESRPWQRHYDYNVPFTIRYPRIPLHDLIGIPSNSYPDKAALNFFGTEITFWELRLLVLRMANALAKLGVQKGDKVGMNLPNCPQYLIANYAALSLGAVVVNLNPMYTTAELKHAADKTGMTTLFTFDMVLPNIRALCQEVEIQRVIVTKVTDYITGLGQSTKESLELEPKWYHFSELLDGCTETRRPRVQVNPEDPCMIQFTGGTTGVPKAAVLTHANLVAATFQCALWGSSTTTLTPPERRSVVAVLPYFHVYGNIVVMNWAMLNCATQIVIPRFQIDEIMGTLENFKEITFFPAVPTMITAIINHPKAAEMDLGKKLGLLNSGAAPMPQELIEQVKDMGIFFSEGWGMSETTSLGVANPIMGMKKVGSIGVPFPDTDIRIVDVEQGVEDVKPGEPGELLIKSPLIMREYYRNPEETAGQIKDGWLSTGDIVVRDEDDYLFVVDRKKDMVIAGGFNIYPREIDEVLYQHPKVLDAVSVGIADEYRGETMKAYVVLKPGETASGDEIIAFCKEKLATYKVPKLVEFRDALPKSAVGKVLRKILRAEEEAKRKA